jgi:hypothetical protein
MANNPYTLSGTTYEIADWTAGSTRIEVRRNNSAVWMRITRLDARFLVGAIAITNLSTGQSFGGVPVDTVGSNDGAPNDLGVLWFLPSGGNGMQFCSAYVTLTNRGQKIRFTASDDSGGKLDQTLTFDA